MAHPYNPRERATFSFATISGELLGVCTCTHGRAKALAREYSKVYECEIQARVLA